VKRRRVWTVIGVVAAAARLLAADVRITPVVTEGKVFASVAAPSTFTPDVRDAVQSGLPITFTFIVDLRRPSAVWFDHTVSSATVASSVKFDNLTGKYQVSHLSDGRVDWSKTTDKEDEMRAWATEFERVPLSDGASLEPNAEYYVRVRVRASPHRSFFPWPWARDDADSRADFTFIR
jgi:hypothetical protein